MRRMLFALAVMLLLPQAAQAQGGPRFDPVVFLSTLRLNQLYGEGNIRIPDGVTAALVDSVVSNKMIMGFSMLLRPDSGSAWLMWIDFDSDRYYRPRMSRVFAQRPVGDTEKDPFGALRKWVESVQKKNLGDAAVEEKDRVAWPWLTRTGYALTIRRVAGEGASWLTLELARGGI